MNSVEWAVRDGVPYAIDFMNPAPDMDVNSLTPHYFQWAVRAHGRHGDQAGEATAAAAHTITVEHAVLSDERDTAVQLEDYFDFLAPDDIRIKGHRIGIETILHEFIYRERGPRKIQQDFPTLTLEQVYATILYYLHNKEAISKYLADWMEYGRRSREEAERKDPAFYEKWRRLKAEWMARKAAGEQ